MEIKLKLDTEKTAKATVAIACAYGLARVSEASDFPQLAAANALALIIIIAILYGPYPAPKKSTATASGQPQHPCACTPSAMLGAYACQHAFSWRQPQHPSQQRPRCR